MCKLNTRDHFSAYFLESNQTIENIFLFRKYFSPEKIWYLKNILHWVKHSLSKLDFVIKFKQLDESVGTQFVAQTQKSWVISLINPIQ